MKSRFYQYLSAIVLAGAVVIAGCGHEQLENAHEDHAETGHEGHNHGPGEHVDAPATPQTAGIDWCGEHLNRHGTLFYNHKPRRKNRVDGCLIHPWE